MFVLIVVPICLSTAILPVFLPIFTVFLVSFSVSPCASLEHRLLCRLADMGANRQTEEVTAIGAFALARTRLKKKQRNRPSAPFGCSAILRRQRPTIFSRRRIGQQGRRSKYGPLPKHRASPLLFSALDG